MAHYQQITAELPTATVTGSFSLPMSEGYFWWVKETVADLMGCDADDVDEIETDDGDMLTVRGEIVGRCYLGSQKHEAPVALAQAAE